MKSINLIFIKKSLMLMMMEHTFGSYLISII